jgi:hypothetical protein
VQNYILEDNDVSTVGAVLFNNLGEGTFIYSLSLSLECSNTTFDSATVKVGQNILGVGEKVINVLKIDTTGRDLYDFNMSGVALDDFEIYLYATCASLNKPVSWSGSLQLIKV